MDLTLSPEQHELVRTVRRILERRRLDGALPVRDFDGAALDALLSNGLLDVLAGGGSPLEAVLVIEESGRFGVGAPVAARSLVAPLLLAGSGIEPGRCVALADRRAGSLVRFGADADQFFALDGDEAIVASAQDVEAKAVESRWGYPIARVNVRGGQSLGSGSGERLKRLWRIALAAEGAGLMSASVRLAADYVTTRKQFGRAIGTYQAVQHRLSRSNVIAEGSTWLARRAAWNIDDELAAGMAATFGADGMREVFGHTQQVRGAIGTTDEFGLTRMTLKLGYLYTELGGSTAHARDYARARYLSGRPRRPAPGHRGKGIVPANVPAPAST